MSARSQAVRGRSPSPQAHSREPCAVCGAPEASKRCSRCKTVSYCSTECQKQGWRDGHKNTCALLMRSLRVTVPETWEPGMHLEVATELGTLVAQVPPTATRGSVVDVIMPGDGDIPSVESSLFNAARCKASLVDIEAKAVPACQPGECLGTDCRACQTGKFGAELTDVHRGQQSDDAVLEAIHSGDLGAFQQQLTQEYMCRCCVNGQISPLHQAAQAGRPELVAMLLDHSASIDVLCAEQQTPLHLACVNGSTEVCQLLLGRNASLQSQNLQGCTPLHLAALAARADVCALLVEFDADVLAVDAMGGSPFVAAATLGHAGVCAVLCDQVDSQTRNQGFMQAVTSCSKSVCELLLNNSDVQWPPEILGYVADEGIFCLMLARGASVNAQGEGGNRPLHVAASVEVYKLLLKHKADPWATNTDGHTAVEVALSLGDLQGLMGCLMEDLNQIFLQATEHNDPDTLTSGIELANRLSTCVKATMGSTDLGEDKKEEFNHFISRLEMMSFLMETSGRIDPRMQAEPQPEQAVSETTLQVMGGLKQRGNTAYKEGRLGDGIESYTRALKIAANWSETDPPITASEYRMLAQCHANRAQCYLQQKEYELVETDTSAAVQMLQKTLKKYPHMYAAELQFLMAKVLLRRANANQQMEKYKLALSDCQQVAAIEASEGLEDAEHKLFLKFRTQARDKVKELEKLASPRKVVPTLAPLEEGASTLRQNQLNSLAFSLAENLPPAMEAFCERMAPTPTVPKKKPGSPSLEGRQPSAEQCKKIEQLGAELVEELRIHPPEESTEARPHREPPVEREPTEKDLERTQLIADREAELRSKLKEEMKVEMNEKQRLLDERADKIVSLTASLKQQQVVSGQEALWAQSQVQHRVEQNHAEQLLSEAASEVAKFQLALDTSKVAEERCRSESEDLRAQLLQKIHDAEKQKRQAQQLERELREERATVELLREKGAAGEHMVVMLQGEGAQLQEELAWKESELAKYTSQEKRHHKQLSKIESKMEQARERAVKAEKLAEQGTQEAVKLRAQLEGVLAREHKLRAEVRHLEADRASASSEVSTEVAQLSKALDVSMAAAKRSRSEAEELKHRLAGSQASGESLRKAKQQVERLQLQVLECQAAVEDARQSERSKLEFATRQLTSQNAEVEQLRAQLAEAQQEIERLGSLVPAPSEALEGPAAVSLAEVNDATDGFAEANWIGSGGQCTGVFRGTWREQAVAVKRVDRHAFAGGFRRELAALSAVRHENVLRVLAYNEEGDTEYQYLVMPLLKWDLATALPSLWAVQRVGVLQGALKGLQALHDANILHFDIKPENILLDNQGNPRLGDCGLARPMEQNVENMTMVQHNMQMGQVGTLGYTDPEFARTGEFHRYCDVYAMGLTILQVCTGRPSVLWHEGGLKVNLTDYCDKHSNNITSIADPSAAWPPNVVTQLLELGLQCTELGRGAAARRPCVQKCIDELGALGLSEVAAGMSPPPVEQKECVVCLENPRGKHRFMPCRHSVCCGQCIAMLRDRGSPCVVCNRAITSVQEGLFPDTWSDAAGEEAQGGVGGDMMRCSACQQWLHRHNFTKRERKIVHGRKCKDCKH